MQIKDAKTHQSPGVPGGLRGERGQRPLVTAAPTGALMQAHSKREHTPLLGVSLASISGLLPLASKPRRGPNSQGGQGFPQRHAVERGQPLTTLARSSRWREVAKGADRIDGPRGANIWVMFKIFSTKTYVLAEKTYMFYRNQKRGTHEDPLVSEASR